MALHTELPIYRTGVRLLDLAVRAQVQMPRTVKRALGEKITQHCVEILDLMALANALHLVAGMVFEDRLDEVTKEVKTASLARFFPKVEKAPVPLASAAQAKGGGGESKSQKPERPLRKCKLSPADAQAAIAAAMQETDPGAAVASQGDQLASSQPVAGAAAPSLAVGMRVCVTSDRGRLPMNKTKFAGKEGTITQKLGDRAWMVTFKGRSGGITSFDGSELLVTVAT